MRESTLQAVDAVWHVLIYSGSALILFFDADWRLTLPLIVWIVGYILTLIRCVPRVKIALGHRVGSQLETDGPDRRRLHQHRDIETVRA